MREGDELRRRGKHPIKSDFLANMELWIRMPMNAIIGMVGTVCNDRADLRQHFIMDKIQQSC